MQLFFNPDACLGEMFFSTEESKHICKVLRHKLGDKIYVSNGKGSYFVGSLISMSMQDCSALLDEEIRFPKPASEITIAIAPTKSPDRIEWFVEKATECGVHRIIPLICHRSERSSLKIDRLQKIAVSACKQSKNPWLPIIENPMEFHKFMAQDFIEHKFVAWCDNENNTKLANVYQKNTDAIILIGPEGDFTEKEVQLAISKGFTPISLGNNIYRTETAGLVAIQIVNTLNQIQ